MRWKQGRLAEAGEGFERALRMKEAGKLGFQRALAPAMQKAEKSPLSLSSFTTLASFVDHMLGRG